MGEERYLRNMAMLSAAENAKLKDFRVCVLGCGGLGGYIIEMLGRIGIGSISAVDGDVFEPSNLNRQLLSDIQTLGSNKAEMAAERMALVNPLIQVTAISSFLTADNGRRILTGHDLVMDALDNAASRFLLQDLAEELSIPLIHGAIAGWYGKVTTIFPGDRTLDRLYRRPQPSATQPERGLEKKLGTPSFTPPLVAAVQVSEAIKVLLGKGHPLRQQMLYINLHSNLFQTIDCPQTKEKV